MKRCPACKYQQGIDWAMTQKIIVGDAEFIKIVGPFRVEYGNYSHRDHAVELYACPRCGCVQMADD